MELCKHESLKFVGTEIKNVNDDMITIHYFCIECDKGYEVIFKKVEVRINK